MRKVLYVRKSEGIEADGGSILDDIFIKELEKNNREVTVVNIEKKRRFWFPLWAWRLDRKVIESLSNISRTDICLILSHESLLKISKYIAVDYFVLHNLFSKLETHNLFVRLYYRINAKRHESYMANISKGILTLSSREEEILLLREYPASVKRIIPYGNTNFSEFDGRSITIDATYNWFPKRLNKPGLEVLQRIEDMGFKISHTYDEGKMAGISILTDRFVVGFKLKLGQAVQRGDVIISFSDLRGELSVFAGYNSNDFYFVKSWSEVFTLLEKNLSRHTTCVEKPSNIWVKLIESLE